MKIKRQATQINNINDKATIAFIIYAEVINIYIESYEPSSVSRSVE